MNVIVCVKHVPETTESEITISSSEKNIEKQDLVFDINEWDDYALEEAIIIKEKFGGTVTAITIGSEDADKTLRKCLARGVDKAIRLTDEKFEGSDGYAIAKILFSVIKKLDFDLVLTGTLSSDYGQSVVGPTLAEMLSVSHVSNVKLLEINNNRLKINRELEGGLEEIVMLKLPAVLSIQTGINEPRYASIMGIRRAMKKDIDNLSLADIGLSEKDVGESGSWTKIEKIFVPPVKNKAEFISGTSEEIAKKVVTIIKSKGLI
jgi:electron transfer flavoprotein beta subunit